MTFPFKKILGVEDAAGLQRALARAHQLWPDPFEAPDVPPRDILEPFFRGGTGRLPSENGYRVYLPAQISESLNCHRALEELLIESTPDHILHPFSREPNVSSGWAAYKANHFPNAPEPQPIVAPRPRVPKPVPPAPDQIWSTSHVVEAFDGRRILWRYTWQPVRILLAEGPLAADGDELWRAIPCTPLDMWGERNISDEETVIEVPEVGEYVLHFRLEYPVSRRQLRACVGAVREKKLLPGSAHRTSRLLLERRRLRACAAWLTATADARRLYSEAQPEVEKQDAAAEAAFKELRGQLRAELAHLRGLQEEPLMCLAFVGEGNMFAGAAPVATDPQPRRFTARVRTEPHDSDDRPGEAEALWEIDLTEQTSFLREDDFFLVVADRRLSRPIGSGRLLRSPDRFLAHLKTGLWEDFAGRRTEDLMLHFLIQPE